MEAYVWSLVVRLGMCFLLLQEPHHVLWIINIIGFPLKLRNNILGYQY